MERNVEIQKYQSVDKEASWEITVSNLARNIIIKSDKVSDRLQNKN